MFLKSMKRVIEILHDHLSLHSSNYLKNFKFISRYRIILSNIPLVFNSNWYAIYPMRYMLLYSSEYVTMFLTSYVWDFKLYVRVIWSFFLFFLSQPISISLAKLYCLWSKTSLYSTLCSIHACTAVNQ